MFTDVSVDLLKLDEMWDVSTSGPGGVGVDEYVDVSLWLAVNKDFTDERWAGHGVRAGGRR
jgi:hypothetical protein